MAKRYLEEGESAELLARVRFAGTAVSRLAEVEVVSALCRRCREGDLTLPERDRLLAALDDDLRALRVIEVTPEVVAAARKLLARRRLRAGDAVQLASALTLQKTLAAPVEFVCFDQRLAAAARDEGLAIK